MTGRPTTHSMASYSAEGSIRVMPTPFGGQEAPLVAVSCSDCTVRDRTAVYEPVNLVSAWREGVQVQPAVPSMIIAGPPLLKPAGAGPNTRRLVVTTVRPNA